ncbi:MAG: putative quinol monooxygenase [Solirubrobacteraceae bacterium]
MIVVIVSTTFEAPSDRDTMLPRLMASEALTRQEPGVVEYRVSLDPKNPLQQHGLEIYSSEKAMKDHLDSQHVRDLASAVAAMKGRISLTAYQGELEAVDLSHLLAPGPMGRSETGSRFERV